MKTLIICLTSIAAFGGSAVPADIAGPVAAALKAMERIAPAAPSSAAMWRSHVVQASTPLGSPAGILVNLIAVGVPDPLLPCFFCAPDGGVGLPLPIGFVPKSQSSIQYTVMLHDFGSVVACNIGFALLQGTNVVDMEKLYIFGIDPGQFYQVWFTRDRPQVSGLMTVAGVIECTSLITSVKETSAAIANVVFE